MTDDVVAGEVGRPERAERRRGAEVVAPRPAATLVLLRPGRAGLSVLLTRRHRNLRFGGDLYVFPGGRLDPDDADHAAAAVRETREETGIEVDAARLIPLTRWVTPPGLPSRFDTRFFAAIVPPGTDVTATTEEVAEWRWWSPSEALEAVAAGELEMWQPTVVTLQQLDGLASEDAIRAAFAAGRDTRPPVLDELDVGLTRVTQPWAEGIEGRTEPGWTVGERDWVIVNPSDPTGETADLIVASAKAAGARIAAVAVTDLEPRHHAGVEVYAAGMALPVVAGRGAAPLAPYPVTELDDGEAVPYGDVPLVARRLEGARPETVRYAGLGWSLPDREPPLPARG
ncbi:MAG TPA: NUDIX domain-containing protein [Candidatus Limnocylindrales bacterium]|nr:NUDIX domain-containing protein [Candidatus Limnocylindrales bacterium]